MHPSDANGLCRMDSAKYDSKDGPSLSNRGFARDFRDQLKHRITIRDGYERARRRSVLDREIALEDELESTKIGSQKLRFIDGRHRPDRILHALRPFPEPQFAARFSVNNPLCATTRANQERATRDHRYVNRSAVD